MKQKSNPALDALRKAGSAGEPIKGRPVILTVERQGIERHLDENLAWSALDMLALLHYIDQMEGSTGGPAALVREFKFRAREILASLNV